MAWVVALLPALVLARQVVPTTITQDQFQEFFGDLTSYSQNSVLFKDPVKGFGFMLTKDVVAGDQVMQVGSSMIITPNDYFEWSPYIQSLKAVERLIARLLYEKFIGKPDSLKLASIHVLSTEAPSSPIYWTEADFELLNEVSLHSFKASYFVSNFQDCQRHLVEVLEDLDGVTDEMLKDDVLKWAYFHVVSRVFDLTEYEMHRWFFNMSPSDKVNPDDVTKILVPVIDMSNHLPRPFVHQFKDPYRYAVDYPTKYGDEYVMRADRNQTAGEEYVWSYGTKNNLALLDTYGFVLEHNLDDYFYMSFKGGDYCFEEKKGKWCKYKASRKSLNPNYFRHLYQAYFSAPVPRIAIERLEEFFAQAESSNQEIFLEVIRKYRLEVLAHFTDRKGIREVRHLAERQQSYTEYQIYTLAIETRETAYTHLELLDKLYLSLVKMIY
jgi:hypothetical protein